jgi:hypothetical protein
VSVAFGFTATFIKCLWGTLATANGRLVEMRKAASPGAGVMFEN